MTSISGPSTTPSLQKENPASLYELGLQHFRKKEVNEQDCANNKQARILFSKASRLGHFAAVKLLGEMHSLGLGGPKDVETARKIQVHVDVIRYELALAFMNGSTGSYNFADARHHLSILAASGHLLAADYLKLLDMFIGIDYTPFTVLSGDLKGQANNHELN